ncbi:uncharacterized protein AB9X84_010592 [Acanthopagrus schlegelii]
MSLISVPVSRLRHFRFSAVLTETVNGQLDSWFSAADVHSEPTTIVAKQCCASKPFITTILDQAKGRLLLQCEVRGASPEPKVEWKDSAGNILPAEERQVSESGGHYDVTIKTSVTKTGRYRCEVTQEEISHQTFAETVVFISEKLCEDQTTRVAVGWLGGFILGAVVFAAVLVGLKATKRITLSCNRATEPTATSTDPTNDIPLLQVQVNGDHQHQNGSSNAPTETPLV